MCSAHEYTPGLRKPVGAAAAAPPFPRRLSRTCFRSFGQADLHPTPKTRVPKVPAYSVRAFLSSPVREHGDVCREGGFRVEQRIPFVGRVQGLGKICESATDTLARLYCSVKRAVRCGCRGMV